MTRRGIGFTIVELIVALAITVLVAAAGIPRITALYRDIQIRNAVQGVTDCMAAGQQAAAAPKANSNLSEVVVESQVTLRNVGNDLQCTRGSYTSRGTLVAGTQVTTVHKAIHVCQLRGSNQIDQNMGSAVLSFSAAARGALVAAATYDSATPVSMSTGNDGVAVAVGIFDMSSATSCNAVPTTATRYELSIPRLGAPLNLEQL